MADTSSFSMKSVAKKAPNVSGGYLVMILAGAIAVVIFLAVTAQTTSKTKVLAASR